MTRQIRRIPSRPDARKRMVRGVALLALSAISMVALPSPVDGPNDGDASTVRIDQPLLAELRRSGLVGGKSEPVRAFSWTIEMTRPVRPPRNRHEVYAGTPVGAPAGLSPMVRDELTAAGETRRTVSGVSVRGLMLLRPGDRELDVHARGLTMPLRDGQRFDLVYAEDGGSLTQRCRVGVTVPAATVHPAIPGNAKRIDCKGRGNYRGLGVRVTATVMYLMTPGVFVGTEQAIESPLGRLRSGTRVLEFAMRAP